MYIAKRVLVREFSDDYIRNKIAGLTDEEAWDALIPITRLGKTLGDLNVQSRSLKRFRCLEFRLERLICSVSSTGMSLRRVIA